jgi:two-component system cell cycle response regulator DivK
LARHQRIPSGSTAAGVPVLAVTAFADPESVAAFLKEGFDQVITKPISIRKLLEEVARYCGGG